MQISTSFFILKLLYEYPRISCSEISRLSGISLRSVYRYLEEFILAGIPGNIDRGRFGGAWLSEEYKKSRGTLGGLIKAYAG